MSRARGDIHIDRPPEAVFDFVADERNEPQYNPRMSASELVSGGSVGPGSRFLATLRLGGRSVPMTVESTGYERPHRLRSHSSLPGADIDGQLAFEPEGSGTRMRWSREVHTHGPARLLGPLISWIGDRQERRTWERLKVLLEAGGERQGGPGRGQVSAPSSAVARAVAATRRWAYRNGSAGRPARAANRAQALLHAAGVWPSRLATLKVRGRRSGRLISVPVVIADFEGERYLVAMRGSKESDALVHDEGRGGMPLVFDLSVAIQQPPETVFAFLADILDHVPLPKDASVEMSKVPLGSTRVGTRWVERVRVAPGLWMSVDSVVTDLEEPGLLGMDFRTLWGTGHLTYALEATEHGTLLHQRETRSRGGRSGPSQDGPIGSSAGSW